MANNIVRYSQPFGVTPLSEAVDQLFRDAFTWPRMFATTASGRNYGFGLSSNLYETNDSYVMQVVLPGVKVDELQITAHQNVLTLQGTAGVAAPQDARSIWVGLGIGEFREQLALPGEVDADNAIAEYHDGILTLTLPKAERARVKTIRIGGGKTSTIEGEKK
jgi:HSP20 family protein